MEYIATTSSTKIRYNLDIATMLSASCNDYVDRGRFNALCKVGCPNYLRKWSCPPYAPPFSIFSSRWKSLLVLHMYTKLNQFSYIKNDYLKIKAANSILKSRADKFLRKMAMHYGSYISTGSCRLCKPCKCKFGLACAHPELMTYSFEALGVNVDNLVKDCFGMPLLWYKPHVLPEYTSVVCGLLTNEDIAPPRLQAEFKKFFMQ